MTGALGVLLDAEATGGGGTVSPATWTNIFSQGVGFTNAATLSTTGTTTLEETSSGSGEIKVIHNGTISTYTGAFPISDGDIVVWGVYNPGSIGSVTGSVTVTNGGTTVGSFTYVVKPNA